MIIRKNYILKCIEDENSDEAIAALKENIEMERPLSTCKSERRIMLKDVYLQLRIERLDYSSRSAMMDEIDGFQRNYLNNSFR